VSTVEFPVIALVCSSGGLDALTQVLGPLPADLPAAVLVLQHTSPETRSRLAEVLAARTELTVMPAEDAELLEPGVVLVAPSGGHLLITTEGRVEVIMSGSVPPYRPSADLLLTSMALAVGTRAIAVVLSGKGNDGATGATAIHHFGGVVIVTDEASSLEYAMPQATLDRDHLVDHVVPLDEVAALLVGLSTAPTLGGRAGSDR
jgi:two-component system chemotaxis response regulator CheB